MILISLWPLKWIQWYHMQPQRITHISLVQGNINHYVILDINRIESILSIYLKHTLPILGKTKIVIWPESAIPGYEIMHNKFLTMLDRVCRKYHTCLVTGIINAQYTKYSCHYYNSIIILGDVCPYIYSNNNRYNKYRLVLCAEQLPCQTLLKSLYRFFDVPSIFMESGDYLQPQLQIENIKITASICYEIIIGNQMRDNFKQNSDFLLTIANNVWFGNSIEPWQYLQMARMRALELGRPILCSTNNGITAFVYADGSVKSQLPQFISDVLDADVIPTTGLTPYARFGSLWLLIVIIIFMIDLLFFNKQKYCNKYYC